MKRFIIYLTISLFTIVLFSCQQKQPTTPYNQEESLSVQFQYTDHYIVGYSGPGIPVQLKTTVLGKGGTFTSKSDWDKINYTVVRDISKEEAETLRKIRGVTSVTRDIIVQWIPDSDEITESQLVEMSNIQIEAHDPSNALFFGSNQWNMRQIDADDAWAAGFEASPDVLVAILDTGINTDHIDMTDLSFIPGFTPIVDVGLSRTFVTSSPHAPDLTSFDDFNFHGTHVAGIVNTNGLGVAGVAPHATLVAVKVLSAFGSGSFADVISGILYAASIPVDVINMSLGADIPDNSENAPLLDALRDAVRTARDAGVYVVAAAGNAARDLDDNSGLDILSVPAESDGHVAAISATGPINQTDFDRLASYSNFGSTALSVAAPGGDFVSGNSTDFILSPCSRSSIIIPICQTGNFFLFVVGTSQAAPHASGLGAFVDSQFGGSLNGDQIKKIVEDTADDLGNDDAHGKGRINVFRALTEN